MCFCNINSIASAFASLISKWFLPFLNSKFLKESQRYKCYWNHAVVIDDLLKCFFFFFLPHKQVLFLCREAFPLLSGKCSFTSNPSRGKYTGILRGGGGESWHFAQNTPLINQVIKTIDLVVWLSFCLLFRESKPGHTLAPYTFRLFTCSFRAIYINR